MSARMQQVSLLTHTVASTPPAVGAAVPAVPNLSDTCDPEPFNGILNQCPGFVLQCRLVFS